MHLHPLAWLQIELSGTMLLGFLGPHSLTAPLCVQASHDYCMYSFYAFSLYRGPPRAAGHSQATPSIATSCSSWCPTRSFSTRYRGGEAALQQLGGKKGFLWSPPRLTRCCKGMGRRVVVIPACAWHPYGAPAPPVALQTHPTPVPAPLLAPGHISLFSHLRRPAASPGTGS